MSKESKRILEIYVKKYIHFLEETSQIPNTKSFSLWLSKIPINPNSKAVLCNRLGKFLVWNGNITIEDFKFLQSIFKMRSYNWSSKALTKEETIAFMELLEKESKTFFTKTRNLLIYVLLVLTGSRISQILGIKLNDIKENEENIELRIKRLKYIENSEQEYIYKKIRKNFIVGNKTFINIFDKYLKMRNEIPTNNEYLFVTKKGKPISSDEYRKVFQRASLKFGKKITPHYIRHTVGTIYANQYGVLKASLVLGHSNISTTQKYISINNIDIEELEWQK